MWYLFLQVWFLLLIAFILGWSLHWYLCCKNKDTEKDITYSGTIKQDSEPSTTETETPPVDPGIKPPVLMVAPELPDDLKRIKGIGKVIEKTLNELGIFHFKQIAQWNEEHVKWIENYVAFPGRVVREEWVSQANTLDNGGTTEFSNRVDKGELNYESES